MSITSANKTVSTDCIGCDGTFSITLALTAQPELIDNPTDMVLILDRSRSMTGTPLASLKEGANTFIDLIAQTTGGTATGQIGGGSRIGVGSFGTTATQDTQLLTSVADLKTAVNGLRAGGSTNHTDAFTKALALFPAGDTNAKVMILFTDGKTTVGGDPTAIIQTAKDQGVTIYAIGLDGDGGLDQAALARWVSTPVSDHLAITPDEAELVELFEDLARTIAQPGATDIVVTDTVIDCFRITGFDTPTHGTAEVLTDTSIRWEIAELAATEPENASLTFHLERVGDCVGAVEVNESAAYQDAQGHEVEFPTPSLFVTCDREIVIPEPCPEPVEVTITGCQDSITVDAGAIELSSLGRMLTLNLTLQNVCPLRRVAMAVILTELDAFDREYQRGVKTLLIPAHAGTGCADVRVECIHFVLPETLDVTSGDPTSLCNERRFQVRVIAHYVDRSFTCCETLEV